MQQWHGTRGTSSAKIGSGQRLSEQTREESMVTPGRRQGNKESSQQAAAIPEKE
jgi:hypothetical protein